MTLKKNNILVSILLYYCVVNSISISNAANFSLGSGDLRINKSFKTYQQARFENIVRQQLDYSCGAAALSTILRFYYNDPVSEADLLSLASTLDSVDPKTMKEKGLSLLDLRKLATHKGYLAGGFKLTEQQARSLNGPVLIYYEPRDYPHFAVLKGMRGKYAYLADPVRGNVKELAVNFLKDWQGITLVVEKKGVTPNAGLSLPMATGNALDISLRNALVYSDH